MADINKTILFELDLKTGKITDETGRVVKSFGDLAKQYDKASAAGKRYNAAQEKINELQENQARSGVVRPLQITAVHLCSLKHYS